MSDDEMIPGDTSEPPGTIAPEDEYARRLAAVEAIRAAGGDPYPVRFDRDRTAASLHEEYGALEPGTGESRAARPHELMAAPRPLSTAHAIHRLRPERRRSRRDDQAIAED